MTDEAMHEATESREERVDELKKILQREYDTAERHYTSMLDLDDQAFKYYEAQPFGNEVDGRSQVVLPDVQETIDYMAQSVLRTFVSGDRTVEFEAVDEADEDAADDATAGINYIFMRQQDGYRILHDGLYDGLLKKIGVFKTVAETIEKVSRETVMADPVQLGQLPEGVEIEDATENPDGTVTAQLKATRTEKRFVDYAVPKSEFRFSPLARHEDEADYIAHVCEKTRSELVEMGFDRDQVYALPCSSRPVMVRIESRDLDQYAVEESSEALERVLLCEEYARVDVDGDGIAERVKVYRVEDEILIDAETGDWSIETVDEQPFSVFCPFPRPHRLVGYSLADKVLDIQLYRSFVARQLMDGMAFANMPRPVIDMTMADETTIADVLNPIPGSPIRARGGVAAVQPFQNNFDVGKSLQVLEWITGERESRTGITRLNQGLDADALNKTATGTALMQAQGQQGEEMIARQLAETMARLFMKKYRLMRAEGEKFKVKVDGQYREVDPATWPEDINIAVRVGLGSNSKDKRIGYRMAMGDALNASVAAGFSSQEHVFKWFDGLARDTGIGQGDDFCTDPAKMGPQPEKPDPEMIKVQAEQQKAQAQLELDREKAGAQVETDRMKAQAQIDAMREKHALDMDQAREKAALEAQLAREKMIIEANLAREQMAVKASVDREIGTNRPGGDLDK